MAADDREQIIEVVRDAAGEPADGFHLVSLAQALLELLLFALRFLEVARMRSKAPVTSATSSPPLRSNG